MRPDVARGEETMTWTLVWIVVAVFAWFWLGWQKLPLGWKGKRLLFSSLDRSEMVFGPLSDVGDGWRWASWPVSIQSTDCREKVLELEPINAITKDNATVTVKSSISRKITNLSNYFRVDPHDLEKGIDDLVNEKIREIIRSKDLTEVLGMQLELGAATTCHVSDYMTNKIHWGLVVTKVNVSSINPGAEMTADLEVKKREELQQLGEMVEAKHFVNLVAMYNKPIAEGGAQMPPSAAAEQANITTKRVPKTVTEHKYAVDANVADVVTKAVEAVLNRGK